MSIKSEVERIKLGKSEIKQTIETVDTSITIPDNTLINSYDDYIRQIQTGSIPTEEFTCNFKIVLDGVELTNVDGYSVCIQNLLDNVNFCSSGIAGENTIKATIKTNTPYQIVLSNSDGAVYKYSDGATFVYAKTTDYSKVITAYEIAEAEITFKLSGTVQVNNSVYTRDPIYVQFFDLQTKELIGYFTTNTTYGYFETNLLKTNRKYCFVAFASGYYILPFTWESTETPYNVFEFKNSDLTFVDDHFEVNNYLFKFANITNVGL